MRVFLDASVFLWALERPESNSARLVDLALSGRLEVVVDELVIDEVARFLRARMGRSHAWLYSQQVRRSAEVVSMDDCEIELGKMGALLKPADRLHLAAARVSGAKFLIAYDVDFVGSPEYLTPKQAAKRLGLKTAPAEW